jgi:hypothetical protein
MVYDDDWTGELNAEDYEPYEAAMARFDALRLRTRFSSSFY